MSSIYLYGGGGHGRVILDILQCQKVHVAGFVDDHPSPGKKQIQGIPVFTFNTLLSKADLHDSQCAVRPCHGGCGQLATGGD